MALSSLLKVITTDVESEAALQVLVVRVGAVVAPAMRMAGLQLPIAGTGALRVAVTVLVVPSV